MTQPLPGQGEERREMWISNHREDCGQALMPGPQTCDCPPPTCWVPASITTELREQNDTLRKQLSVWFPRAKDAEAQAESLREALRDIAERDFKFTDKPVSIMRNVARRALTVSSRGFRPTD